MATTMTRRGGGPPAGRAGTRLVCGRCGAVARVPAPEIAAEQAAIARRHGFTLDRAALDLGGTCRACLRHLDGGLS